MTDISLTYPSSSKIFFENEQNKLQECIKAIWKVYTTDKKLTEFKNGPEAAYKNFKENLNTYFPEFKQQCEEAEDLSKVAKKINAHLPSQTHMSDEERKKILISKEELEKVEKEIKKNEKFFLQDESSFLESFGDFNPNQYSDKYDPEHLDLRDRGWVMEVKDQKQCGSCWSFSAVGQLEALYKRKTGKNIDLSEQQLLDCASDRVNCDTGYNSFEAYKYLNSPREVGIVEEKIMPYQERKGYCQYNPQTHTEILSVTQFNIFDNNHFNEDLLKKALYTHGPISIGVNWSNSWSFNRGEVIKSVPANLSDGGHAILLIGYGIHNGEKYWLFKNSHGKAWADKGYGKLERTQSAKEINSLYSAQIEVHEY